MLVKPFFLGQASYVQFSGTKMWAYCAHHCTIPQALCPLVCMLSSGRVEPTPQHRRIHPNRTAVLTHSRAAEGSCVP